jgi:transposase, IS5 family
VLRRYLKRQIIDATLISVPKPHNTRKENEQCREGKTPENWTAHKRCQKDTEATWTKKHGKSTFGYKLSVNVDNKYKVIREIETGTASVHDSQHMEDILDQTNTSRALYADKAYASKAREQALKAKGYRVYIQRKGARMRPLSACQKRRNRRISSIRVRVEHVFAALYHMGKKYLRTVGQARADFGMIMMATCYDLKRLVYFKRAGIQPF